MSGWRKLYHLNVGDKVTLNNPSPGWLSQFEAEVTSITDKFVCVSWVNNGGERQATTLHKFCNRDANKHPNSRWQAYLSEHQTEYREGNVL